MKIKNWLIGGAALGVGTAAFLGFSAAVTSLLTKTALDREKPKLFDKTVGKVAGSTVDEEAELISRKKAEMLEKQNMTRVEMQADDGTPLVGHFYPAENPKRLLVAMHGWRSNWSHDFAYIASFWHENGCSVLFAEQRGQGESGGDTIGFGMSERHDAAAWAKWADENLAAGLPIYLVGISMGASTVLLAASLDLPASVAGIIADCGFTSAMAIWKHILRDNLRLSYRIREKKLRELLASRIGEEDCSTADALRKTQIPVLLIHGAADSFVPVEMTYENYLACASPKRLLIVPGAAHGMSYVIEKEKYEQTVKDFFAAFDSFPAIS